MEVLCDWSTSENLEHLEEAFRTVFDQNFKNAEIMLIKIWPSFEFEDHQRFRVMIVYRCDGSLDTQGSVSYITDIRVKLKELNEDRFPVMSFVEYHYYMMNDPNGPRKTLE